MINSKIDITNRQRKEMERIVRNWTNYLESVPPTSDAVKVHRCFGANSSIVRKDDFNKKLRTVVDEMRQRPRQAVALGTGRNAHQAQSPA